MASEELVSMKTKSRKLEAGKELDEHVVDADVISSMPDDIIRHIISLLSLGDAITTGILSSRWKNMWKSSLKSLTLGQLSQELVRSGMPFTDFVSGIVDQLDDSKHISKFEVSCVCLGNEENTHHLDKWISFALTRHVRILLVSFSCPSCINGRRSKFPPCYLDREMASSVEVLTLMGTSIQKLGFTHFTSIKSLSFKWVNLSDSAFKNILSSCLLLEELGISRAEGLAHAAVVGSCLRLQRLFFQLCTGLKKVEIAAPNLEKITYMGDQNVRFLLKSAPKLSKAYIGFFGPQISYEMNCLSMFSRTNDKYTFESMGLHRGCALFTHLQVLVFDNVGRDSMLPWFLKACPALQKLGVGLSRSPDLPMPIDQRWKKLGSHHKHLQEIKINNFAGRSYDMELVWYLVKAAVALEKLSLYIYRSPETKMEVARAFVEERLRKELPPSAKLELRFFQPEK